MSQRNQEGKLVSVGTTERSSQAVIPELEADKGYKYLDILEANDIMHIEMKGKIQNEYYRTVRQLTSLKLGSGNTIREINSSAVSLVRYSAGILKQTKDELKVVDKKTQKIITMNRTYQPQIEGGGGLLSIVDCVETEGKNISLYFSISGRKDY